MQSKTFRSFVLWILLLFWFPTNGAKIGPKAVTRKEPTTVSAIKQAATSTGVCTTTTCKAIAKRFLDRINATVDPCDDFYEYSCGKWITAQTVFGVSDISQLDVKTRNLGKDLLKGKIKAKGKTFDAEVKAKSLFKQCTNQAFQAIGNDVFAAIEKLRGTPVIRILEDNLGGWPLISPKWNAVNYSALEALGNSSHLGSQPLFSIAIDQDAENPSRSVINLDAPQLVFAADILQSKEKAPTYLAVYAEIIHNVTTMLLRDSSQATNSTRLAANITDIVQMEHYLGLNMLTKLEVRNDTTWAKKLSLRAFKDRFRFNSSLLRNITECLQRYFALASLSHMITDDTVVIVSSSRYWPKLDAKLLELERQGVEGRRRLATYIGWKLIYSSLDYLSEEYRAASLDNDASVDIEENCLTLIKQGMPLALGALYVRDIVPFETKEKATIMVNDIKSGFRALLEEATWMDNVTHQAALHKLAAMKEIVAYPDFMANNMSAIDSQYQMIAVQETFLDSVLQISRNRRIQQMREVPKIRVLDDPLRDTPDISEIGASYKWDENKIRILAGILNIPFFEVSAPQYLNYGAIGYIIAHEITHGFDDTGANYDSVGLLRSWWTNTTLDAFNSRANTIIEQYSKYTVPSGRVNGALTVGENIADNGGFRATLKGYTRYSQRLKTPEAVLPGLEKFTPLQLFFLAAAQASCTKLSPFSESEKLLTDDHAPAKWRINGPVSNIPEFAQTFKCSSGSKMNPRVKNRVW